MKLIETDIRHAEDEAPETATPPRPEHRRVYVSLLLTFSVLAATVATIYLVFPKRDNEILTASIEAHEEPGDFELEAPSQKEVVAWSVGVVGRGVPWPDPRPALEVVGARSLEILNRPAAVVRYRAAGHEVTLVARRPHDAPPRTYRRREDGLYAVSYRRGKWTMTAVGPEASLETWSPILGVP